MYGKFMLGTRIACVLGLLTAGMLISVRPALAADEHTSTMFQGVKANTGTVTHHREGNREILTLSSDFQIPDAPAPHWQIVDSAGNVFLLERLKVKEDKVHREIVVPPYIHDIARVQIWCAWAETLLGETAFQEPIPLTANQALESAAMHPMHTSKPFQGVKANTGAVVHTKRGNRSLLTLTEDFKVPDAPAPHWQIVDSHGKTYLLQRLDIKGGKFHRSIVVPPYISDIAKVQIWCAWAEVLLGEASFDRPVK